jgi:putative membrane protein
VSGPHPAGGWSPYCGPAPHPAAWLTHWNFDPLLLGVLGALAAWWFFKRDRIAERGFVALAFAIVLLLFVSPLCALGSALFSARAVHHVVLAALLAPVLAVILLRNGRASGVAWPLATIAHAATFWAWHLPSLYGAALASDALFWLMQATITGTAVLLWQTVMRAPVTSAVAALLATMVQMGALGALLTFAARPLYAPHWSSTAAWGLSPLEDQQLAGLFMSAPGSLVYLLAAVTMLYRSLQPRRA